MELDIYERGELGDGSGLVSIFICTCVCVPGLVSEGSYTRETRAQMYIQYWVPMFIGSD